MGNIAKMGLLLMMGLIVTFIVLNTVFPNVPTKAKPPAEESKAHAVLDSIAKPAAEDANLAVDNLFDGIKREWAAILEKWWNGGWVKEYPSNIPPARYAHGMVHDFNRKMTVMFGGRNQSSYFDDTWEFAPVP